MKRRNFLAGALQAVVVAPLALLAARVHSEPPDIAAPYVPDHVGPWKYELHWDMAYDALGAPPSYTVLAVYRRNMMPDSELLELVEKYPVRGTSWRELEDLAHYLREKWPVNVDPLLRLCGDMRHEAQLAAFDAQRYQKNWDEAPRYTGMWPSPSMQRQLRYRRQF